MNILLLGSGGREYTLAWNMSQSPLCDQLYIAPGNAGTPTFGINVAINPNDFDHIAQFALENQVDMIVVGPEEPLVRGIVDYFKKDEKLKHIHLIGPAGQAALLEGSKAFAKRFMETYDIPTAAYQEFSSANIDEGLAYIATQTPPIVLKADGLAAGKGVLILDNIPEAQEAFKAMLGGKFGEAGSRVVIEQFLDGIEFSVFALTDGKSYQLLPVAKDYKRIGEGDVGLNTGGMGAISPVSFVDETLMEKVIQRIVEPTIKGIHKEGFDYKGFVFFGIIKVGNDPYVIEYNCRMGDPETEVVIPRLKNDLVALFQATMNGTLANQTIEIDTQAAATIMLVSGGYPEAYEKGKVIEGLNLATDSMLIHAGTKMEDGKVLTNGGRVMAITSMGKDFKAALEISKKNAQCIQFEGKNYRKDIGFDL